MDVPTSLLISIPAVFLDGELWYVRGERGDGRGERGETVLSGY